MKRLARKLSIAAALVFVCASSSAQEKIENWSAPALWSAPAKLAKGADSGGIETLQVGPTPPLHFVGLEPCRLVDTRGNGFTGQYGPPALTQGVPRTFVLTGQCGIGATAEAVSLNVTVTNTQGPGHIIIYPAGAAQPTVSTLNYVGGQTIANAAVVPLGDGGAITVVAGVSGTDLILDTNGDYRPGVVTSLNGLFGAVNLAAGSNVTITPAGQTLTIASTGGLPAGTANQTLRHDGSNWVASSALKNNGTDIELAGALNFTQLPNIRVQGVPYIHAGGGLIGNTMVGYASGPEASFTGTENTGVGGAVFLVNTTGSNNTAVGSGAMSGNVGGSNNTALGHHALDESQTGSSNIAIGRAALSNITTGNSNIGIGVNVGTNVLTGSNNIYIGNPGFNNESGQIRIGDTAFQTGAVIVGIYGSVSGSGVPVLVNGGGRLGTTTSSRRFKLDVRDIGAESDGLMDLRPVAFKYKPELDPTGERQYGLIAEEVAEVYPELVVYDKEGRPENIRYHLLAPLLLNELQKQRRSFEVQRGEIESLKAQLAKLAARLESDPRN